MRLISLFIIIILFTAVFAQKANKTDIAPQPVTVITTVTDSAQYILGAYLGQYIVNNGFSISNANLFIKGMDDVLHQRQLLVNATQVPVWLNNYQQNRIGEMNRVIEKQMFDSLRNLKGIGILPSGICYNIEKVATGNRPRLTDSVELQLKGYLPNGQLFEDTYSKNAPYRVTPATLMPGLSEIVQIMPIGSVWRVYIPASLAFAEKGVQGIVPPYSAVVFLVELVK
jgi:FKBP-type peptidyl-prolyl cis-trans isomerase